MTNMQKRVISALVLAPIFISGIMLSKWLFIAIMVVVACFMLLEWCKITRASLPSMLIGFPAIALPIASLIYVRLIQDGEYALLMYFVMIWSIDIFAMFGGKTIEGPKLAPKLSPKKTWSGLLVGSIAGGLVPLLLSQILYSFPFTGLKLAVFGFCIGLVEQGSDLFVSFFKRRFDIKDSGNIIPGHGGFLDRFDGIIFTAPILLYYML